MRILIMVHSLTGGGAERVAVSWANGLSKIGNDVLVFTSTFNQTYILNHNVKIIQRHILFSHKNSIIFKFLRFLIRPFAEFVQLFTIIKKHNLDVIIDVLYLSSYPLLMARWLSLKNIPIIMTDHNAYERPKETKFKWKQWKNKFIDNRLFNLVTVLTQRDKEILEEYGIKNVEVLHNPLFLTPEKNVPIKKNTIIAVGRLDAWQVKGFDILIKAWNLISSKYPDWRLKIIGDGSEKSLNLLKSLSETNTNQFDIIPFTRNIVDEYREAAIFVLSSRYEGWGLVAVEAMSQGCAVIACDYKGRQEEFIENGENGILCEPDNIQLLTNKLFKLLDNPQFRYKLQNNALKNLSRFDEINIAKHLISIIYKIK